MPGIQLPIGIDTVNPVDADFKRGPWASIPAALAGINIALRYNNLSFYVVGDPNEYYWLDTDLTDGGLLTRSTGGASIIYITRVALQALIAGSTLQEGAYYAITDFLDKEITDVNSVVIVTATSTNTISQIGFWKRLTQNKAYGAFALDTGVAGSVDQVTVGGVTLLMTASVPYAVSRINTANLVAANINANSGVSGYSAIVIAGETVIDRPAIVIESTTAGVNTSSLAVTVTTLTVANLVNLTMGVAQVEQTLDIAYDIVADRIINCYDPQYGITMKYTVAQITTLTYNPIVNWRWGHPNFRNWTINGTGYRNFFDFPSISGANTIEQNNNLSGGVFQNVVIRRTSAVSTAIINNTNNMNFSNVQFLSTTLLSNNTAVLNFTNITATTGTSQIVGNEGSYANALRIDANRALILLNNTSATSIIITNNNTQGLINFTGVCAGSLTMTFNFIDGIISNSASTYAQLVQVNGNSIQANATLNLPAGTKDFTIQINNNIIQNTLTLSSLNITVPGFAFTMANCTFIKTTTPNYNINFSATGSITINEVFFRDTFSWTGNAATFDLFRSVWVGTSMTMGNTASFPWTINIADSTIENCGTLSGFANSVPKLIDIQASQLINVSIAIPPNMSISGTYISNSGLNAYSNSYGTLSLIGVTIDRGSTIELRDTNYIADVTIISCQISASTLLCWGRSSTTSFFFVNTVFINVLLDTYDAPFTNTFAACNIQDSHLENTIIQNLGVTTSPNTIDIARCKFFNSTFNTQTNSLFLFYDCEISNNTITAPPGGNSFTFQSCIFQYQNTDFSVSPAFINYDISDLTLIKDRGLMKKIFTFDGGVGSGQVGVPCIVIPDMIGADVTSGLASLSFTAIITKATIAAFSGLTSVGGSIDMAASGGPTYIAATPVATLNANYLVKNEPAGVINEATKYNIIATPTIASITAGYAEFAIEFLIAP